MWLADEEAMRALAASLVRIVQWTCIRGEGNRKAAR